ncbi:MAG: DUF1294 domain-containing protein [Acutalibacteraceae bacterium]
MNKNFLIVAVLYFSAISLLCICLTVYDKVAAKKGKRRISEKSLMICGLFGGALAELLTMKLIRHKTLHKKFMIGLPCEIVLHLILAAAVILKIYPK